MGSEPLAYVGKRPRHRLEAALYVIVAALLALLLLDRLQHYAELAERAAMETTLTSLQTALQVKFMLAAAHSGPRAVADAWRGRNPFVLAGSAPTGYLGERESPELHSVAGGSWLFDSARRELIYIPRSTGVLHLPGTSDDGRALRFELKVEGAPGALGWAVRLVPIAPPHARDPG